jgi:serine protease Do
MASPIVDALRTQGEVSRGWLGVRIQDLTSDLRQALSLKSNAGVLIADVQPDGPAAKSGLRSGDVVTVVGESKVTSSGHFRNLIASSPANTEVSLTVVRDGKTLKIPVSLGSLPDEDDDRPGSPDEKQSAAGMDGLGLKNLDDEMRKRLHVAPEIQGVVIAQVTPGSKAAQAGLHSGDIVLSVDRKPVTNEKQAEKLYRAVKGPKLLQILRQGVRQFVVVK